MSAAVWPPIDPDLLLQKEEDSLRAELRWLLDLLQENLGSLKSGLQECVALLVSEEPGTTLAISSHRSESVKGIVTRVGTRLVKGEVSIRLASLPPNNPSTGATTFSLASPFPLPQLQTLLTLLNHALDIIDISAWTGDPQNASFISSQLKLLADTVAEARAVLQGGEEVPGGGGRWYDSEDGVDEGNDEASGRTTSSNPTIRRPSTHHHHQPANEPPPITPSSLLTQVSPHFSITSTALDLTIRTLVPHTPSRSPSPSSAFPSFFTSVSASASAPPSRPSTPNHAAPAGSAHTHGHGHGHGHGQVMAAPTPHSHNTHDQPPGGGVGGITGLLRTRLGFGPRLTPHDEEGRVFRYRNGLVSVREKVVVESQDPGLLAIGAKLGVVAREIEGWRVRVQVVVGGGRRGTTEEEDEEEEEGEDGDERD